MSVFVLEDLPVPVPYSCSPTSHRRYELCLATVGSNFLNLRRV